MSQAMNSAMSGINANQLNLSLIADNVANLNTTAYKESQMTFKDVWYQTKTTGTAPTNTNGGTNPYQIGVGTAVQAVTKNFEPNSINTTGRSTDMAIEGHGYFTVMDGEGSIFLTRDGNFSLDANGNLVTSLGYKVLGTNSSLSLEACEVPILMPQTLETTVYPQPDDLLTNKKPNELNNAQISPGVFYIEITDKDGKVSPTPIEITVNTSNTFGKMIEDINTQLTAKNTGVTCSVVDGGVQFALGDNKDIEFTAGTSNFVQEAQLASLNPENGKITADTLDYKVNVEPVNNIGNAMTLSSFSVGVDGVIEATYSNGDKITVYENPVDHMKVFRYTTSTGVQILGPSDVTVNKNLMTEANLQMQFANVTNEEGLVSIGTNMYTIGPDCGQIVYTKGNTNGIGSIRTGGLEASNVDLSRQFSNMILAQRGIQANSRVFDTANTILETIVYLGRG